MYKLGRIQSVYDDRCKMYGISRLLSEYQTLNWVTKVWDCPVQLDQKNLPSCTGNGHAACMASMPVEDIGVTEDTALKIYNMAQTLDGIPDPHEGSTVLAAAKAVKQLWPTAYMSYNWGGGLDDTLAALSHIGPAVIGIDWHEACFTPDENGFIHPTGVIAGGHCLLARGIDVENKFVLLRNSWSCSWGLNGDCKISWDDLRPLLTNGGESVIPLNRSLITV
jgi:hypothetical protein